MDGVGTSDAAAPAQPDLARADHREALSHRPSPSRSNAAIDLVLKVIVAAALFGELGVVFFSILSRSLFGSPWLWANEAAELALSTMAFVGGAFAYRRGEHASIRTLLDALPPKAQRACGTLVELLILTVAITAGLNGIRLFNLRWRQLTPVLQMRVSWFVIPLVAGMLILAVTAIEHLLTHPRRIAIGVSAAFAALVAVLLLTQEVWRPWVVGPPVLTLMLVLFFGAVLLGLPVGFALMLGALVYIYASGTAAMVALAHSMVNGVNNFVLLAVPFFILAGIVMNHGGLSLRLVRFVQAWVGHLRGGLYQVMVVSMYIVSGLSGAKVADVAAVGLVMRDMLIREGYSLDRAAAVLTASAAMGETVPPSIAMLVLGSVTTLSIGTLFVAGLMPAAVVALCLMVLIYFQARRSSAHCAPRASLRQRLQATCGGVLPLLMPVIILGGIMFGLATPTEISSFAVVYGIVLAGLVYRELGFRTFITGMVDCAAVSGMILFILAGAYSFAWTLTVAQLPQRLVGLLSQVHQSQWIFMLGTIVLLIITGSILEGLAALLILAPILMPIASKVGVNEIHYGIVLVIAMGIGCFMPPIGVGFYVTCAICETKIENSARAVVPYLIVLCVGLLLVAFVPWFTLYLPGKFHLGR